MKHPFAMNIEERVKPIELKADEIEAVSGGLANNGMVATTLAVGEEGGVRPIRPIKPVKPPIYTTLAVGEEGGAGGILL